MISSNYGGKREGAGRKTSEKAKKMVSFRLAPDVLGYLNSTGRSKAQVIEEALREHKLKEGKND